MLKTWKMIVSLVLVFTMSMVMCVPAFASNTKAETKNSEVYVLYNSGGTKVEGYKNASGDMIFTQEQDGIMVQRNIIRSENKDIIEREFFGVASERGSTDVQNDTIRISDFITIEKQGVSVPASSSTTMGTINYRAVVDTGVIYYGLRCSYVSSSDTDTYTINNFTGKVVDLVSLLVGAIAVPFEFVNPYVTSLLAGLGIAVLQGEIKDAVTDTVSSDTTTYTWTLQDTTSSGHHKNVYGYKYYIIDTTSHTGETYYEGYTPNDWEIQALAVWFHNEMFPYSTFDVVSWS